MAFDDLLNARCKILRRPAGRDSYGQKSAAPEAVLENWPCRVSTSGRQPREWKAEKRASSDQLVLFMRPPECGVSEHDFLEVAGYPRMDVVNVAQIAGMGSVPHHLQVTCEVIKP